MKDKLAADAIGAIQQCIFSNGFSQGLNFKQRKGKIKPSKLLQIRHFFGSLKAARERLQKDSVLTRCHKPDTLILPHPARCADPRGRAVTCSDPPKTPELSRERSKQILVTNQN